MKTNGWARDKLHTLTSKIGSGATPLGGEAAYKPKGISLIRSLNVHDSGFRMNDLAFLDDAQASALDNVVVEPEDVLFNITGASIARSCIVPPHVLPARVNQHVAILRPRREKLLPHFLHYLLISPEYKTRLLGAGEAGATRQALTKSQLQSLNIDYPPLPEQRRIVGILDKAFAGIATAKANAEKNLQNARAVFESELEAIFLNRSASWVSSTIGDHIRFIDYRGKTPQKTQSGLRLITAKNVKMGYLQEEPREFVAPKTYSTWMTRGIPRRGDVLFTTEAPLANVAQLDTDEKVVFAQRIIIMQPDGTKLNSTFLKYMLLSRPVQERIHAKGTGATVSGIKASLLRLIEIAFPKSTREQEKIVHRLDAISSESIRLAALYQRKLDALDELKQALLHEAFSGQL